MRLEAVFATQSKHVLGREDAAVGGKTSPFVLEVYVTVEKHVNKRLLSQEKEVLKAE